MNAYTPPHAPAAEPALAALSEAALVVQASNEAIHFLLHALIEPVAIERTQREVLLHERDPMCSPDHACAVGVSVACCLVGKNRSAKHVATIPNTNTAAPVQNGTAALTCV